MKKRRSKMYYTSFSYGIKTTFSTLNFIFTGILYITFGLTFGKSNFSTSRIQVAFLNNLSPYINKKFSSQKETKQKKIT